MKVVRQWMINTVTCKGPTAALLLIASLTQVTSCNPTQVQGTTTKSSQVSGAALEGKAYIYRDSPYFIAGSKYSPSNPDMSTIIDHKKPELITLNTQLTSNCTMNFFFGAVQSEVTNCVRALADVENLQALPRKDDKSWVFSVGSKEFYQTNMLYHLNLGMGRFFSKLEFAHDRVNSLSQSIPRSIPPYLKDSQAFWFKGVSNIDNKYFRNGYLNAFANCNKDGNASFSPAGPELCFGNYSKFPNFWFVQDPSVVYHEQGHSFVSILMNLRNSTDTDSHALRSNLGSFGYDEAGAINEGLADYFSYINTRRTHIGEWAMGKTGQQSRPMSEADPMHIEGIDTTSEGRLSYPQFLLYDPNFPNEPFEDIHYAGQIASHYLVALTESLKTKCTFTTSDTHEEATSWVIMLLAETLSELGDLNAKGVDDYWLGIPFSQDIYFNNLDPVNSFLWTHSINQPTYRRLFQVFAKNINRFIPGSLFTGSGLCPLFTKNDSEKLLDDYGLLLFKTYNDNGNSTTSRTTTYSHAVATIPLQGLTTVNENNRRKSVLVSKQLIELAAKTDATPNAVSFYIIDGRTEMENLLKDLLFKGFSVPLSTNVSSVEYNNSNIKISPGEIIAVIPNLFNNSNSTMAGVQLLATDWDHVQITDTTTGNFKPCVFPGDTATTVDQGGQASSGGDATNTCDPVNGYPDTDYKRLVKDPTTKLFPGNAAAPVCMVLLEENNTSRWVSQSEFRKKQGLSLVDKDCLGFSSSGTTDADFTFNPHECLVRFLPGATESFFSKIDPQNNFFDSVVKPSEKKEFNSGNLLIMEINKWIPPGTKFRCRLRARFTNCTDCYHDLDNGNDDFLDSDYNGHKPYKVINFDFDVND